ncbi:MAG: PAS domain-containing protein [Bacteroidota bacterium]
MKSETQMLSAELETHRFELEMSINELQVTNQALKEREEYLSNMIEHASEGIMIVNQSGLINSANHVVCNLLDIENHQLINKPLNLFINKAVKKEINAFFVLSEHNEHFKTKANLKQWNKKESIPVQISISALKHFFDKKFLVILTDLSKIVKIKEDLAQ